MLGIREKDIYGSLTFKDLTNYIDNVCKDLNVEVQQYQSNHEGNIVDKIQSAYNIFDGIVINPAAYTHTSVAILDALKAVSIPCVEVHISDVKSREDFRQISFVSKIAEKTITGKGFEGYKEAIEYLVNKYQ